MKLVNHTAESWEYQLDENEFRVLAAILEKFPFTDPVRGKISETDDKPSAKDREKFLNESLAEHREELQRTAGHLLAPEKIRRQGKSHWMTMDTDERETLLQILNDIRVGCWHTLGQPDNLEPQSGDLSPQEIANYSLMNVAGYFEHGLVLTEE
jgi:hypothetical protein